MRFVNRVATVKAAVVVAPKVSLRPLTEAEAACFPALAAELPEAAARLQALRDAVRQSLRTPRFKPTGRNKPASEYLAQAMGEGRFPIINNVVDANNYVSLASALPISMLDLGVTGDSLQLRLGRDGERYVFNRSGQEIELDGLACVTRDAPGDETPLGNPIKDSMLAKTTDATQGVVAIIYAPVTLADETLRRHAEDLAGLLVRWAGATGPSVTLAAAEPVPS